MVGYIVILYYYQINSLYFFTLDETLYNLEEFHSLVDNLNMRVVLPDPLIDWQVFTYDYNGQVGCIDIDKAEITAQLRQYYRNLYKNVYNNPVFLN